MSLGFRSVEGYGRKETLFGIVVLAALISGLVLGLRRNPEQKKIDRARVELTALVSALETFKKNYGDYPNIPADGSQPGLEGLSSERLFLALTGWRDTRITDQLLAARGKIFVDPADFHLKRPWTADGPKENQFVDPWGNPYRYAYFHGGGMKTFVLFSCGPDGDTTTSAYSGGAFHLKNGRDVDADNVYAPPK